MLELEYKESWAQNNCCFSTVLLEKILKSPLDCMKIKPVNRRKSVLNIHWKEWCWSWSSNTLATDVKNQLIRNDPDAGKDRGKEEQGTTQDEMLGWHHWLNRHEFEQTLGDGEGQGSLVCCSTSGRQESVMTQQLSNNKTKPYPSVFVQIYSSLQQNELVTRNGNPL